MKLRDIRPSDASKIADWLLDERVSQFNPCQKGAEAKAQAKFWASGLSGAAIFVAEDEKGPLGLALCITAPYHKAKHWSLLTLLVDPKRWGGGIGTKLLERAESWARESGIERFIIELFESPAQPWFERRGFVPFLRAESALKMAHGFRASIKLKKEGLC